MEGLYLVVPLAPLLSALLVGLFGRSLGKEASHWLAILGVGLSFVVSLVVLDHTLSTAQAFNGSVYTWLEIGKLKLEVGFLVDRLTSLMMVTVTFVSLMVHIYTIGYMRDDPGYQRFFSYIALFTFAMLMLVMSNNFLQLFFGWEAVGLVSYLLIGFWYTRDSAIYANLKAFLVNRVGDFGFLLGIAVIYVYFGTLDYWSVFQQIDALKGEVIQIAPGVTWSLVTVVCLLLFIGAMGKSAQAPLHVWLPDSMEGPTPISALIHAATMVTAGIFMVARMSPLYEVSETALSVVMVVGAITALFMGVLGIVQQDIKRVIAYSTLSQLGYMTVALGVSAYTVAIFHLMTHAFFKALLFLAAGSVIVALHHEQDMRNMGGLRRYMPTTYITSFLGSLALVGFPGFSGFYSKDLIIEAVHHSHLPGADIVHFAVTAGIFVTAFYSFRLFFMVFHGKERFDAHVREHLHESPRVITLPLVLLAIPSVVIGYLAVEPLVFGGYFQGAVYIEESRNIFVNFKEQIGDPWHFALHGFASVPFALLVSGFVLAWYLYLRNPSYPAWIQDKFSWLYGVLASKYGFDDFNDQVIAKGGIHLGSVLWKSGDIAVIDDGIVNGSAQGVAYSASVLRWIQSGYLNQYALLMLFGLILMTSWLVYL